MAERLDVALATRGLARSRTHAATLIAQGLVTVDGAPVVRASAKVGEEQSVEVAGADHYVSRGAHKLVAALDAFDVPVTGRL
ncbi:S4 domain protein, partial [Leifsonia aquatica ATCC 14665]